MYQHPFMVFAPPQGAGMVQPVFQSGTQATTGIPGSILFSSQTFAAFPQPMQQHVAQPMPAQGVTHVMPHGGYIFNPGQLPMTAYPLVVGQGGEMMARPPSNVPHTFVAAAYNNSSPEPAKVKLARIGSSEKQRRSSSSSSGSSSSSSSESDESDSSSNSEPSLPIKRGRFSSNQQHLPATQILISNPQVGITWPKELKLKETKTTHGDPPMRTETGRWTEEEDEKLRIAVKKFNARNWREIAKMVPGRDYTQCSQRWKKVLDPNVIKGQWSPGEDELLLSIVSKKKPKHWGAVAKLIKGRSAKQCRERYKGHLDPNLLKVGWSNYEDSILMQKYSELGRKWSAIARCLSGRTDNQVKARVKTLLRAQKQENVQSGQGSSAGTMSDDQSTDS